MYSLIKKFNFETKKIIIIEASVEYKISQVQQIHVNDNIGLGFKTVLKNILRQDPVTVLVSFLFMT